MKRRSTSQEDASNQPPHKRQRTNSYNNSAPAPVFSKPDFKPLQRPIAPPDFDVSQTLEFQHIDTEYYIGNPPATDGDTTQRSTDRRTQRAVIRLYGVTSTGLSVCCHCVGFAPYFYCRTWPGFVRDRDEGLLGRALNLRMKSNESAMKQKCDEYVTKVVSVEKQSIWGYNPGAKEVMLKVYLSVPTLSTAARKMVIEGFQLDDEEHTLYRSQTLESNINFALRYMIDQRIVGAGWIAVNGGQFARVAERNKSSTCSIELVARWDRVVGIDIAAKGEIAPLRVLSFDIECMCGEGFPEATRKGDQVIQISNVCSIQGSATDEKGGDENDDEDDLYFHKNVFTLNTCAPIAGCNVYSFANERDLLSAWAIFMRALDPDILTGYNIVNFDLPYLLNRADFLKVGSFAYLGRERTRKSVVKESSFSSKAYGSSKNADINIAGRVQMDLLPIIRRDHKLRSYSLNAVSFEFLKSQKEDVHYSDIAGLQTGTEQTRRRLAVYCLKDSILPLLLIEKLCTTVNLIEMARVTGVPINFLITRGQQIKVLSQLYRTANPKGMVIPYMPYDRDRGAQNEIGYEGATVIEPKRGYYTTPITTLDFASLYPSIMIAHNLCYTSMIPASDIDAMSPDEYTKCNQTCFIKKEKFKGLLPEILTNLLTERKKVKGLMKALKKEGKTDTMQYAVYNGRQLALKVSANSVYGFTGATVGALPCLAISSAVTSFGRDMIHDTKAFIEKHYTPANGFANAADVVYGDTDSVMIRFRVDDIGESMKLGKAAAELVTKELFIAPIKLEFEKVYKPYLLMNKKRYAGMLWTRPEKWDYMDAKGIETVRRDNCTLTKNLVQNVLNYCLIDADSNAAVEYTKNIISKLLQNKIDLSSLIISKKLNKIEDYKVKAAHVMLVLKMRKRGDATLYKTGDRVSYVITKGAKKAKAYEKAEDPLFALEHGVAIDTDYYLSNQLAKPLTRMFEPILGAAGVKQLFNGPHTRCVKVSKSTVGAMFRFTVKKKTCLGCKCSINSKDKSVALCPKCKEKESQLYMKQMAVVRKKERAFHVLWTQCQRCQGSLTQEVLCSNRDCPIFFKRSKVRKDMKEAQKLLQDFSI